MDHIARVGGRKWMNDDRWTTAEFDARHTIWQRRRAVAMATASAINQPHHHHHHQHYSIRRHCACAVQSLLWHVSHRYSCGACIQLLFDSAIRPTFERLSKVIKVITGRRPASRWPLFNQNADKVRNVDLWKATDQEPAEVLLIRRRTWIGHTLR